MCVYGVGKAWDVSFETEIMVIGACGVSGEKERLNIGLTSTTFSAIRSEYHYHQKRYVTQVSSTRLYGY